jgi:hypothetical protein
MQATSEQGLASTDTDLSIGALGWRWKMTNDNTT